MPYGQNQGQGQGHSREVDRQSPTGLIFVIIFIAYFLSLLPCASSGVVRIDPLRFLTGCRKRRLNQVQSVLSLSLGFFWCVCCAVN